MSELTTIATTKYFEPQVKESLISNNTIVTGDSGAIILDSDCKGRLPIKGAYYVEGNYGYFNEEEVFEQDFSVTVFYDRSGNLICWEQDSPPIAYHNMKQVIMNSVMDHNDRVA